MNPDKQIYGTFGDAVFLRPYYQLSFLHTLLPTLSMVMSFKIGEERSELK